MIKGLWLSVLFVSILISGSQIREGRAQAARLGSETGLELPRYVSLGSSRARLRAGPGTQYSIEWVYVTPGIPLEIIAEYGNWRKVRDWSSAQGWMYHALLSGRRTAIVAPWQTDPVPLKHEPSDKAATTAILSPGVKGSLERCDGSWCRISIKGDAWHGYVSQAKLWGVYPGEALE
ncbi:SH3 domain-containing protein [Chelativorans sp. AA-79]|uniref:SH3 domain-containing protein n=1 Tax=Chelativorans sp. AA-79 TaxID=3028735 RepID=UPI0023F670FB|nr:SH3 domain-containing protein [Chelativorans sp. AA-79]WEX08550.1 SH3 domain-containing protein [Chelativorans sp. AA-79]